MKLSMFNFLQASTQEPGSYAYYGIQSWVYYLFGAIFVVLTLISLWYTWKVRNTKKEYENIIVTFSWFKRFWYSNRFTLMIMITIILGVIAITFFSINSIITSTK